MITSNVNDVILGPDFKVSNLRIYQTYKIRVNHRETRSICTRGGYRGLRALPKQRSDSQELVRYFPWREEPLDSNFSFSPDHSP